MSWLFEDPTTVIVAGLLIEGLLAVAVVKSGRGLLMVAMAGVLGLVSLCVLIERIVVTDRERIEETLSGITTALEANDVEGVLTYIDPQAGDVRARVRMALAGARITEARIFDLEVALDDDVNPPTAQAHFTGRVKGSYRGESAGRNEGMVLRRLIVHFRLHDGRWLLTAYQDRGAIGPRHGE